MSDHNSSANKETHVSGCLVHLFWTLIGNFVLVLCLVLMIRKGFSSIDIVYWVTVGFMLITRYLDIKKFQGINMDGKQSTVQDWKRYSILLIALSSLGWIGAHLLSEFFKV